MEDSERPTKLRKLDNGDRDATNAQNDTSQAPIEALSHERTPESREQLPSDGPLANNKDVADNTAEIATEAHEKDAEDLPAASSDQDGLPMSKSQLKRLRKQAEWDAGRENRKLIRKEKTLAKRERQKAAKEAAIADGTYNPLDNARVLARPLQLPVTLIIDCDFDDLMRDNERMSLGAQLTRSYSDNKKSPYRAHLAISSFGGKLRERFDVLLKKMHENWQGVRFLECDFVETAEQAKSWMQPPKRQLTGSAFEKYNESFASEESKLEGQGEIVYLSSDADETLHELKPFSTYIIGGLVDRNRERGLCHRRATERGIKTARLPIGSYMDMQSRKVLATNHVVEIMLKWLEHNDWGTAFMEVIPKRKGGTLKSESNEEDVEEEGREQSG